MDSFTFGVITYNQEKYIIEHLESVKRVIQKYGNQLSINIIISDDASKDNTVLYAKKWLEENKKLFNDVRIITHDKNQGIVNNFKDALKAVKTNKFKILAGDDLYCLNNIFLTFLQNELIISPVYSLKNGEIEIDKYNLQQFNLMLWHEENIKSYLIKWFKFYYPLITPGIMYTKDLVDDGFYESISENHWIEDVPSIHYLINKHETNIKVCNVPYVIYRDDVGISNDTSHNLNKEYMMEVKKLQNTFYSNYSKYPTIYLNPFYYLRFLERKYNNILGKFLNRKIKMVNDELYSSVAIISIECAEITKCADLWYKKNKIKL